MSPLDPLPLRERLRLRWGVEPRVLVALAVVVGLGIVLAVGIVWRGRSVEVTGPTQPQLSTSSATTSPDPTSPDPTSSPGSSGGADDTEPTTTNASVVVVDVTGAVVKPGVVRLPAGARVIDVIGAAGGVVPGTDTTGLNLARVVSDGEQVLVGVTAADNASGSPAQLQHLPAPPVGGAGASPGASGPLDINAATADELEALPGVGPVLAARIVTWREQNGSFASVDELNEVSGIGEATFGEIAPLVRV